jgi:hypothetical protein
MLGAKHEAGAMDLDQLIFEIIRDLDQHGFSKTATRQDINDLVLDHLKDRISSYVQPAIERLVNAGRIVEDRDSTQGRPYRYYLPSEA